MNTTQQRWCAWAIVPFLVIYLFGFIGLAGFVPPQSPTMTGAELMDFYNANRLGIRAGMLLGLVATIFLLFWGAAVSAQMARIEKGPLPILSMVQYVVLALLAVLFMICNLLWSIAAFREDISPELLRTLNDSGWLVFVMAYPEYVVQLVCIAVVGLADKRARPFLPRWMCFFTFWVAFAGTGGGFATFFKTGPFTWNGLLGFWLPVIFFLVWLGLMVHYLLAAIRREENAQTPGRA